MVRVEQAGADAASVADLETRLIEMGFFFGLLRSAIQSRNLQQVNATVVGYAVSSVIEIPKSRKIPTKFRSRI